GLALCVRARQCLFFFFFQAEDGIRDATVTGVQTCALPILPHRVGHHTDPCQFGCECRGYVGEVAVPVVLEQHALGIAAVAPRDQDRKSTRLNSSHGSISYAVFCLKKKSIKTS